MSKYIPFSIAANAREFLAGIAIQRASEERKKVKAAATINAFIKSVDKDMREVYDKFIPNVHVVNITSFANIIANKLSDTYPVLGNSSSKEYQGLKETIDSAVSGYHSKLLSGQSFSDPVTELNRISLSMFDRVRNIDNTLAARNLGSEFSAVVTKVFGNKAVLASVTKGLSGPETYVFFSSSFNGLKDPFRKEVYAKIIDYLVKALDAPKDFKLGEYVNLGHAALRSEVETFVNSPAFAQVIYGVGSGRSKRMAAQSLSEAAEVFKIESRIVDNYITIEKDLLSTNNGLAAILSLGVTFTNIEDATANQVRGATTEKKAVRDFQIEKPRQLSRSEMLALERTLLSKVLDNNPQLGRSSRSVVDFIQDGIKGLIEGKPTTSEKTKTTVKHSRKATVVKKNTAAKGTKFPKVQATHTPVALNPAKDPVSLDLSSLLLYINNELAEKIKENMGGGNSRSVLNYRSGRFAKSAEVERLTLGRGGLITAYYTYMKYPYATFSEGGKQSSPRSRDPKLLISKSIREIASKHVGDRLRAVVV